MNHVALIEAVIVSWAVVQLVIGWMDQGRDCLKASIGLSSGGCWTEYIVVCSRGKSGSVIWKIRVLLVPKECVRKERKEQFMGNENTMTGF